MAEESKNEYEGQGLRGPLWTGAGAMLANLLTNVHGGGGLLGGGSAVSSENAELKMRIASLEAEKYSDSKDAEIFKVLREQDKVQYKAISDLNGRVLALETAGPLKEQLFDQKIARVADSMNCCCTAANTAIAGLQKTIGEIGQYYVNATSVSPMPMSRFNSWTTPTSTQSTQTAGNA